MLVVGIELGTPERVEQGPPVLALPVVDKGEQNGKGLAIKIKASLAVGMARILGVASTMTTRRNSQAPCGYQPFLSA